MNKWNKKDAALMKLLEEIIALLLLLMVLLKFLEGLRH